jgi:choline-sulfatase
MTSSTKPNFLIIMTDHQRADTILPDHPCIMPNVEALARQGVRFDQTYCPTPHCCPSRATFMSGLYPTGHGIWNNVNNEQALHFNPNPNTWMWSHALKEAGYDLAYSGKWHVALSEGPAAHGFRELQPHDPHEHMGKTWTNYQDLAKEPDPEREEGYITRRGYGPFWVYGEGDFWPDQIWTNDAVAEMPKLAAGQDPWAMVVGMLNPHDPYVVPQKYLDMYELDDIPLPENFHDDLQDKPRIVQRIRRQTFGQLSEREVREAIRHFYAMCTYIDDMVGQLLQALDDTGQAENTVVLFCSDHGDYCGEHGLFAKGIACFQSAYHVPAVIRYPKGIQAPGRAVEDFISLADFAPTFAELAGATPPETLHGRSLVPFLQNRTPTDWRDDMHHQCNGVELYYSQRAVMTKDWKYVFNGFDFDELYDRRTDPLELKNLADDPQYQPILQEMCKRMWRFAHKVDDGMINDYITVALAPYGPAEAFRE